MNSPSLAKDLPHNALYRADQLLAYLPFSRSTLWTMVRDRKFPQPVRVGMRCTAWKTNDVIEWIEALPRDR